MQLVEGIIAKFWWQKNRGKKGIHWCALKDICVSKDAGGLGFRKLDKFNIALLAKQGWRLINYPNSLLARVLKAKYYPNASFLTALLGNTFTYLEEHLVGKRSDRMRAMLEGRQGDQISVWTDIWISGNEEDRLQYQHKNDDFVLVSDLIDEANRTWKADLINNTFRADLARKIKQIPLVSVV